MPYKERIKIDGKEYEVEITEPVPKIPEKMRIGGLEFPVDKELFKFLWIAEHMTEESRQRLSKQLLKEIGL